MFNIISQHFIIRKITMKITIYLSKQVFATLLIISLLSQLSIAQSYDSLWLRYDKVTATVASSYNSLIPEVQLLGVDGKHLDPIKQELKRGLSGLMGKSIEIKSMGDLAISPIEKGLIVGTTKNAYVREMVGSLSYLGKEGYIIRHIKEEGKNLVILAAQEEQGLLYGTFHFLRLLQQEHALNGIEITEIPKIKLRMVNHWDDPAGHVERGYAGKSIFSWDNMSNLTARDTMYMRLMTSVGINASSINNVNTKTNRCIGWQLLRSERINDLVPFAKLMDSYGIKMYLSVNFAAPILIGGLETADPLDPKVIAWWEAKAAECFEKLPGFGGFLVKADSEHEPGPITYGRNHADGANMLAKAVVSFDGNIIWRAFIYFSKPHPVPNLSDDGSMHPYEYFSPLDGKFEENVIVQSKFGSVDFQVREPLAPVIGGMPQTNTNLEVQITQEYTGQSTHLCYLVPQWKSILETDTYAAGVGTTIEKVIEGSTFDYALSGVSGVMNFGDDENWTGLYLAQANTYGFGRLAWNPSLSNEEITEEWVRLTYGNDSEVVSTISNILLKSWKAYEDYTSPLGIGMLTDIMHFDPAIDSRWAKRHHFEKEGVGRDRTIATGTGYTSNYHQPLQNIVENIETCPEEWLLFFHHVPYTHKLKSGKTMIQYVYDRHYEGVAQVEKFIDLWKELEKKIDKKRYSHTLKKFQEQLAHSKVWRDHVNGYFYYASKIEDEKGRLTKKVKTQFEE